MVVTITYLWSDTAFPPLTGRPFPFLPHSQIVGEQTDSQQTPLTCPPFSSTGRSFSNRFLPNSPHLSPFLLHGQIFLKQILHKIFRVFYPIIQRGEPPDVFRGGGLSTQGVRLTTPTATTGSGGVSWNDLVIVKSQKLIIVNSQKIKN
jgi:hypothetical protein